MNLYEIGPALICSPKKTERCYIKSASPAYEWDNENKAYSDREIGTWIKAHMPDLNMDVRVTVPHKFVMNDDDYLKPIEFDALEVKPRLTIKWFDGQQYMRILNMTGKAAAVTICDN